MKIKFQFAALAAVLIGTAGLLSAEVVEEETWYNAGGEVVKKVKRTYSGADANRNADWEPQWVIRERQASSRVIRYSSGRSCRRSHYYSPWVYGSGYSSGFYPTRSRRSGWSGFYHDHGSGGSHWGLSYRGSGVSLRYRN